MELSVKPGTRLYRTTCDTDVVVVRAPVGCVDVRGGAVGRQERSGTADGAPWPDPASELTQLGARDVDDEVGIEPLCPTAGRGPRTCDGRPMDIKAPTALPASD